MHCFELVGGGSRLQKWNQCEFYAFSMESELLIWAVRRNYYPLTRQILDNKHLDVNVVDANGRSPLSYAAEEDNFEIAELLINRGANVDIQDYNGKCALYYAIKVCSYLMTKLLLESGASRDVLYSSDIDPLYEAFRNKNYALVCLLLGLENNVKFKPHLRTNEEFECLKVAILYGWNDVLRRMIKCGANAAAKDENGYSLYRVITSYPTFEITDAYRVELLFYLTSKGVSVDLSNNGIQKSMELLARNTDVETMCSFVKQHLCSSYWQNLTSKEYLEILKCSLQNKKHNRVFKYLFEKRYDSMGMKAKLVALYGSISANNTSALKFLLKLSNIDIECISGKDKTSPLQAAIERNRFECVCLLLSYGASINKRDDEGGLPFENARRNKCLYYSLIRQIAILEALDKFIDKSNYKVIDSYKPCRKLLKKYHEECSAEIKLMRESSIHDRLTLFDILVKKNDCIHDQLIVDALTDESILENFPIYKDLLSGKFRRIHKRSSLTVRAEPILMRILNCDPNRTFSLITEKISNNLRIRDLRNLISTCENDDKVEDCVSTSQ